MPSFYANTDNMKKSAQDLVSSSSRLEALGSDIDSVNLNGILEGSYRPAIEKTIRNIRICISEDVLKLKSLGDALEAIGEEYRKTEQRLCDLGGGKTESGEGEDGGGQGDFFTTIMDGIHEAIIGRRPDHNNTTTQAQELAADDQIRREIMYLLNDPRFSVARWQNASVEERRQIIQEYLNEVSRIYGLQDVNLQIDWRTYEYGEDGTFTLGSYDHSTHTVSLNEDILQGNLEDCDPLALFGTVAHELRHAYQHEAIDHPGDFMVSEETLDRWQFNFNHYIEDPYEAYRRQPVEQDARSFQFVPGYGGRPDPRLDSRIDPERGPINYDIPDPRIYYR